MTEETNDTTLNENNPPSPELQAFEADDNPYANISIGDLLRSKREEKGVNLKTISQQTKIHMGLLEHLENNELNQLPSKTYVRGFVKSAAKILGIKQDVAMFVLESTYNRQNKNSKAEVPNVEMRNETARNTLTSMAATPLEAVRNVTASSTSFLAIAAVTIFILGVVGFNIKNIIDRSAEEHLKLPQVFSTIHQKIKPAPKAIVPKVIPKSVEAELAQVSTMKVNLIQDKKDNNPKTEVLINDVSLKNISSIEKQFTEDSTITGAKLDEIFPSRYKVRVVKGVENIFINATDGDSWITYKVDEKEIKKYVLRQGRSVFIRGEKIRLFLGNTKTIKVFYNNKLISFNSKSSIKNLVFPEEIKSKFMTPLFVFQKDGTVLTSDDFVKANQKLNPGSAKTIPENASGTPIATDMPTPSATAPKKSRAKSLEKLKVKEIVKDLEKIQEKVQENGQEKVQERTQERFKEKLKDKQPENPMKKAVENI